MAEESEERKEANLMMRLEPAKYERMRQLSDYAANEGLIPSHHRGNLTSFINWCVTLGEETLRQHALKKRGF